MEVSPIPVNTDHHPSAPPESPGYRSRLTTRLPPNHSAGGASGNPKAVRTPDQRCTLITTNGPSGKLSAGMVRSELNRPYPPSGKSPSLALNLAIHLPRFLLFPGLRIWVLGQSSSNGVPQGAPILLRFETTSVHEELSIVSPQSRETIPWFRAHSRQIPLNSSSNSIHDGPQECISSWGHRNG